MRHEASFNEPLAVVPIVFPQWDIEFNVGFTADVVDQDIQLTIFGFYAINETLNLCLDSVINDDWVGCDTVVVDELRSLFYRIMLLVFCRIGTRIATVAVQV